MNSEPSPLSLQFCCKNARLTEDVPCIVGIDKYLGQVDNVSTGKLKRMGSATASNGAVGLYHVEGITPEAMEQGRDLPVEGQPHNRG